jgi:membrane fusion protein, peptide pheromone/bacteriocin exporter
MTNDLYPSEFVDDSLESHLARLWSDSRAIYVAVCLLLTAALVSLPLIHVDVTVRSLGIVRPMTERLEVRARTSGILQRVHIQQGQQVHSGDILAVVQAPTELEHLALLTAQLRDKEDEIAALRVLAASHGVPVDVSRIFVAKRRQEYAQYRSELSEAELQEERLQGNLTRARALREQHFLPDSALEDITSQWRQAHSRATTITERYGASWHADLAALERDVLNVRSEMGQLHSGEALNTVAAPSDGTVAEAQSLAPGSFVQAGDRLAVVSPTASLVAELQVPPRDVGLLRAGMPARLQVDAFDYTEWGQVTGHILEISDDYVTVDNRPMFRVRCSLDQDQLRLRNGASGHLKKGMTLQGRFLVARRSVFQMLYQNVNDWLNPMRTSEPSTQAGEG